MSRLDSLLFIVTGEISNQDFSDIPKKCHVVFQKYGIDFEGEFLRIPGLKTVHYPSKGMFGLYSLPTMWIVGLDSDKWSGDKLRSLIADLETATGILIKSSSN